MIIDAKDLHFKDLNNLIRDAKEEVVIENCLGQRYIGCGMRGKKITINGTPGNALGAYLDGSEIYVRGNAQDATGDTMNDGKIVVYGDIGDAPGYGMRGGKIYVLGNSGYRTGIHIKEYSDKKPVIVIGGAAGSFLGEYMSGGLIVVLGINAQKPVGNFTGTGMHGGKIFIRGKDAPPLLPAQVSIEKATKKDLIEIEIYLKEYADLFGMDYNYIIEENFFVLKPNAKNPYKRLYTVN